MEHIKNTLGGMGIGLVVAVSVYIGFVILISIGAFLCWDAHTLLKMFEYNILLVVCRFSAVLIFWCGFAGLLGIK